MLEKLLILVLVTSFATPQFSSLQAMERPTLNHQEIDAQIDDCFNLLIKTFTDGASDLLYGSRKIIQSSWQNRRKIIFILAVASTLEYLTKVEATERICSDHIYIQEIKRLLSEHLLAVEEGNICTDKAMESNALFLHLVDNSTKSISYNYERLYEGIRQCIDTYFYNKQECLDHLSTEILNLVNKKNS